MLRQDDRMMILAKAVPKIIRKSIVREGFIQKANPNFPETKTPMEFLFDVYNTYIDKTGHFDDFHCPKCRAHILSEWKKIEPYLIQLNSFDHVQSNA